MRPPVDEARLRELARRLGRVSSTFSQDLDDVTQMLTSKLVDPGRLRELYEAIESDLYKYPAIDPAVFRRKLLAVLDVLP